MAVRALPGRFWFGGWGLPLLGLWLLFGRAPLSSAQPAEVSAGRYQPPRETSHEPPPRETSLEARRSGGLRIRWRASVQEEGGQFLLYFGTSQESLRILAERVPQGRGWYEVAYLPASSGSVLYELRYRDRGGREHVLTSEAVKVSIIDSMPSPAVTFGGSAQSLAAFESVALPAPGIGLFDLAGEFPAVLRHDEEPLTPPPERRI